MKDDVRTVRGGRGGRLLFFPFLYTAQQQLIKIVAAFPFIYFCFLSYLRNWEFEISSFSNNFFFFGGGLGWVGAFSPRHPFIIVCMGKGGGVAQVKEKQEMFPTPRFHLCYDYRQFGYVCLRQC